MPRPKTWSTWKFITRVKSGIEPTPGGAAVEVAAAPDHDVVTGDRGEGRRDAVTGPEIDVSRHCVGGDDGRVDGGRVVGDAVAHGVKRPGHHIIEGLPGDAHDGAGAAARGDPGNERDVDLGPIDERVRMARLDDRYPEIPVIPLPRHRLEIEAEEAARIAGNAQGHDPERIRRAARHDHEPLGDVLQSGVEDRGAYRAREILQRLVEPQPPRRRIAVDRARREEVAEGVAARRVVDDLLVDLVDLRARAFDRREELAVDVVHQVREGRRAREGPHRLLHPGALVLIARDALRLGQLPGVIASRHDSASQTAGWSTASTSLCLTNKVCW
jgi:hypothetical protein